MRGGHLAILRSGFGATKESEVAVGDIVPVSGTQFEETLASASPDLLRAMIHLDAARDDILRSPRSLARSGARSGPTTAGTAEQGDPAPHRRRGHLPRPRRHHPPGRRGAGCDE